MATDELSNFDDVVDNMAVHGHGVEVETIIEGQNIPAAAEDLDFIVQQEVETTTDGVDPNLGNELDPVENVLISLQNSESSHDNQDGRDVEIIIDGEDDEDIHLISTKKKRKGGKKESPKAKRAKKGSKKKQARIVNRKIPNAIGTAQAASQAKEANEASFDPRKIARKWSRMKAPIKTLDGEFSVDMWTTGWFSYTFNLDT